MANIVEKELQAKMCYENVVSKYNWKCVCVENVSCCYIVRVFNSSAITFLRIVRAGDEHIVGWTNKTINRERNKIELVAVFIFLGRNSFEIVWSKLPRMLV